MVFGCVQRISGPGEPHGQHLRLSQLLAHVFAALSEDGATQRPDPNGRAESLYRPLAFGASLLAPRHLLASLGAGELATSKRAFGKASSGPETLRGLGLRPPSAACSLPFYAATPAAVRWLPRDTGSES